MEGNRMLPADESQSIHMIRVQAAGRLIRFEVSISNKASSFSNNFVNAPA